MKLKRLAAYIIDILLISILASLLFTLPVFEKDMALNREASNEFIELITSTGSEVIDQARINHISYKLNYSSRITNVIEIAITVIYFGIIQFAAGGMTLGKKLMKIKIKPEKDKELSPGLMFLRSIILYNVIFKLISTIGFIVCKENMALKINSYTNYLTIVMDLIIIGTIIFREDERGLHDLICKTTVVNTKKEK